MNHSVTILFSIDGYNVLNRKPFITWHTIDIIDEYELNFNKGNIIKYILRSGKKSKDTEIQDLQKAMRYCQMEIERLNKKLSKK